MATWSFAGAPEGVAYLTAIRDELKERVEAKKGYIPEEKFRILTLFIPQLSAGMKLLDWMENEHGAVMVYDPSMSHWGEVEIVPSKPLESLARKSFAFPVCRQMLGPFDRDVIDGFVKDAIDYKAEGAIYYAHAGCRQGCATIRPVKDALKKEAGIPTLTVDMDYMDPTYASEEEMKDKVEGFFELLEDRK
jgi:benzoyl-CoA reductase subunit B